jgi:DNA polymerase III subunit delta'
MLNLFPWQNALWQQTEQARQNNRLAHALLLSGPAGMGKSHFANFLSASLLCFAPVDHLYPCNQCKSCNLFNAGNHPDYYFITAEEAGKQIKVEQIRDLIGFINLMSQYERYKIAVIDPADAMNRSAANTLLKTLEEPPPLSILILVSHRPDLLPVTVRSRCQQVRFNPDINEDTVSWLQTNTGVTENTETLLKMAGGTPIAAAEMLERGDIDIQNDLLEDLEVLQQGGYDPVRMAEKWNRIGAIRVFQWLLQLMSDMTRLKSNAPVIRFYQSDTSRRLQRLTNQLDLYKLSRCYDLLLKNYGLSTSQISFNTQGLLEDFSIYWQAQFNSTGG